MTFIRVKMMGQTVHARAVQQDSTRKYSTVKLKPQLMGNKLVLSEQ